MISLALEAADCFIRTRFLQRVLGRRYPLLFAAAALLAARLAAAQINVAFSIAGGPLTNQLYYGMVDFAVYCALFPGGALQKAFYDLLIYSGYSAAFYAFATVAAGVLGLDLFGAGRLVLAVEALARLAEAALLEWMGWRFARLRGGLPPGYAVSLLVLAGFIFAALSSVGDATLTIALEAGTAFASASLLCSALSAAGVALSVFAVLSTDRLLTQRLAAQQYELLAAQCLSREEDARRTAAIRHDMKNHLLCMESLLRSGHTRQALDYLDTLTQSVERLGGGVCTGNLFCDAVIQAKLDEAKRRGVTFEADFTIPPQLPLDPVELCCVLGNALDNAIEACGRLGARGPGRIEARGFVKQNQLVLEVRNPLPDTPAGKGAGHGIGLENMRRAVQRCGGALALSQENGTFCFSAMLPLA